MGAKQHTLHVAGVAMAVLAVAVLAAAVGVASQTAAERHSLPWNQAMAVTALQRARSRAASRDAAAQATRVSFQAHTAADVVRRVLAAAGVPASVHVDVGTPFPCVTAVVPSSEDQKGAVAPLVAAGFVPNKGLKEFKRQGAKIRVRTQGTAAPPLPRVPTVAAVALRALDDLYGGRHYLQPKSTSEGGLQLGDGPAANPGTLCTEKCSGCGSSAASGFTTYQ